MKKILSLAICAAVFWSSTAYSAPECYEKAEVPAHEFPFVKDREYFEAVSLDPDNDGKCLPPIAIYKGEPLIRQPLYAPLREAYGSYYKGMNDVGTMRKLVAFLKPAPRKLREWLSLWNEPETPRQNVGGTKSMEKLISILAPNDKIAKLAYGYDGMLHIEQGWPLLFLLMGGVVEPGGNPALNRKKETFWLSRALEWRFPTYVLAREEDSNRLILR